MERKKGGQRASDWNRNIMNAPYVIPCFLVATLITFCIPEKDTDLSEKVQWQGKGEGGLQLELHIPSWEHCHGKCYPNIVAHHRITLFQSWTGRPDHQPLISNARNRAQRSHNAHLNPLGQSGSSRKNTRFSCPLDSCPRSCVLPLCHRVTRFFAPWSIKRTFGAWCCAVALGFNNERNSLCPQGHYSVRPASHPAVS